MSFEGGAEQPRHPGPRQQADQGHDGVHVQDLAPFHQANHQQVDSDCQHEEELRALKPRFLGSRFTGGIPRQHDAQNE